MGVICSTCGKYEFPEGTTCDRVGCPIYLINQPCPDGDHWTMPEDPEEESRPGWGWFKLDKIWWFPKLDGYMKWHDKVTKKGSIAQRLGITVERINEAQRQMLKDKGIAGWLVDNTVRRIQRFFYEGPKK